MPVDYTLFLSILLSWHSIIFIFYLGKLLYQFIIVLMRNVGNLSEFITYAKAISAEGDFRKISSEKVYKEGFGESISENEWEDNVRLNTHT